MKNKNLLKSFATKIMRLKMPPPVPNSIGWLHFYSFELKRLDMQIKSLQSMRIDLLKEKALLDECEELLWKYELKNRKETKGK